jgi:hypothetical protein
MNRRSAKGKLLTLNRPIVNFVTVGNSRRGMGHEWVAQSCTLLYRGFAIRYGEKCGIAGAFNALPNAIRRYGR